MAEMRIVRYSASWNHAENIGLIELHLQNGETRRIDVPVAGSFGVMLQILQKDANPYLVDDLWISTGMEHPGDPGALR
ncbi:MAG TPA: hypothetical protein VLA56_15535 [Pseudomonadales bacterium]|nr:hypothetical protein [Pseudomonadales bacterium]